MTNRKITKEHVWPAWLADYIPDASALGHAERWSSGAGRQRFPQRLLAATVRAFCETCNSGWMSQLELAAKPIVGPMVSGLIADLDTKAQQVIANWVALKGLVAVQTSQTEQPIPERHYKAIYDARGAPANTIQVWIGQRRNLAAPHRLGVVEDFSAEFMPLTNVLPHFPRPALLARYLSEGGIINATIFRVGHFFALVIQHDWPGLQVRPIVGSDADYAFKPIWPAVSTVRWPPLRPVDVLGNSHHLTKFFEMMPPEVPVMGS
jgi:hypothetical protein